MGIDELPADGRESAVEFLFVTYFGVSRAYDDDALLRAAADRAFSDATMLGAFNG